LSLLTSSCHAEVTDTTSLTPIPEHPGVKYEEPAEFALPNQGTPLATATADRIMVHAAPNGEVAHTLDRWSRYGHPLTLKILDHRRVDGEDWLMVLLPVRPNGTTGWLHADDVAVTVVTVAIEIYLDARTLIVTDDDVLLETTVAIGHPETPTPPGDYYVTDLIDLQVNPTSVYGAFAIGLSGYSEVLETFDGGPPQLAIHGTPRPDLIGQAVSNGCIRVTDETVLAIADLIVLGTPVTIHA